jgi:excisionase family DNA binding protein
VSEPAGFATLALLVERLIGEVQGLRADLARHVQPAAGSASPGTEALWTAAEVATYLRCSRSKVYQAAEAGTLPRLHVGGQLRFEPERVKAWARNPTAAAGSVLPMRRQERSGP